MTGLTVVIGVVLLLTVIGRISLPQALAIGGATPSGAALIVGSTVVPTFYAVAMAVAAAAALRVAHARGVDGLARRPFPPGCLLLAVFFAWSLLVTLAAPLLFDGQLLTHPGADQLVAGTITSSNVAQIVYLFLGICVVVYLARSEAAGPWVLGTALGACLVLSFARYLALQLDLPFPGNFFDSSPNFIYIETVAGGGERVRGILSEPAALANTCVTGAAYFLARSADVRGARRYGCLGVAGIAAFLGSVSTSATFVVAGLTSAAIFLGLAGFGFLARRVRISLVLGLLVCCSIVGIAVVAPRVIDFVRTTIDLKLGSGSFDERSSADAVAIEVFLDTFGFGVGLGASRPSSFIPTLLSSVGLVGALLFVAALTTLLLSTRRDREARPVVYALAAFMIVKIISGPDLSDPTGTLWLSLGVLARYALVSRIHGAADAGREPEGARGGSRATGANLAGVRNSC